STRSGATTRTAPTTKTTASSGRDLKYRRLVEVNRQPCIVTISNRTLPIRECRVVNRTTRLKFVCLLNRNTVSDAVIDWHLSNSADRYKQSAVFYELLQVGDTGNVHPTTHVACLIRRVSKVWCYG